MAWPSRVVLAISAFKTDEAVLALLASVCDGPATGPFSGVIVVDSLGSGRIPGEILSRGWTGVTYHSADRNLGSAGNLAERLQRAARTPADFVYAVNHDAPLDLASVATLVAAAAQIPRIGAAYPLRRRSGRDGTYDLTGKTRFPLRYHGSQRRPAEPVFDVFWGSSNGTLYALAPVREGLLPMADLWMGWEDLAYGWALADAGWRQVVVTDAVFEDPYEYATRGVGPVRAKLTSKPSWYAYYFSRNLVLASRRARPPVRVRARVIARIAAEIGVTAALRPDRANRLKLLLAGIRDGLRGRAGKYVVP
jgi:GT2 family glycosyltransferase